MKTLAIFDLDGTLLNTIEDLGLAANFALKKHGYPEHDLSSYPMMVGNGVKKLLMRALPEDDRTDENVEALFPDFTEYYDSHCTEHTEPYPGIVELLRDLSDRGVHLAVASNKYQSATEYLVRLCFPGIEWVAVEGQKEGVPVKPDPSVVFEILAKCPTPKSQVIYIGDSGVDMETARRACVESVGVTWGFRPYKELREYFAGHIVSRPDEILDLIASNEIL